MNHPALDVLAAEPPSASAAAHLEGCPRCRVALRLHRAATTWLDDGPAPSELTSARRAMEDSRQTASAGLVAALDPADTLPPGRSVGPWVVQERLGAGAMATVYRVRHAASGEVRALKWMDASSQTLRRRIAREARTQSALRHPNVVRVHEAIEEDSRIALIMDLVRGPSLQQVIADGALDEAAVLHLGLDVLDGVAAAHAHGVLHRDLKPANVLVELGTSRPVARVADFGTAREQGPAATRLTRTGAALGTPAYMAPEQIDDASSVDAAADVFAVGCVLYELATGRRPFRGDTLTELFAAIRRGTYPPIPDDGLPAPAAAAIAGALTTDRSARPSLAAVRALWVDAAASAPPVGAGALERLEAAGGTRRVITPSTLPPRTAALFGREEAIGAAAAALREHRCVVVAGPPGSGRSAVALEVARRCEADFPGGVFTESPPEKAADALVGHEARALVLCDPGSGGAVASLLARPGLKVLATTAESLRGAGVTVTLEPLRGTEAIALLRDRLRTDGGTRPEDETLAPLVAASGGRPLVLVLLAALLRHTAVDALANALAGGGDPLDRCLALAWRSLGEEDRAALQAAAALGPSWTADELAGAAGLDPEDAEDRIDALVFSALAERAPRDGALAFAIPDAIAGWLAQRSRRSGWDG